VLHVVGGRLDEVAAYTPDARTLASTPKAAWRLPLKLFEYMAAWRPIIASRPAAVGDVLADQRTGCAARLDRGGVAPARRPGLRRPDWGGRLRRRSPSCADCRRGEGPADPGFLDGAPADCARSHQAGPLATSPRRALPLSLLSREKPFRHARVTSLALDPPADGRPGPRRPPGRRGAVRRRGSRSCWRT
jgi:hypothetical protein